METVTIPQQEYEELKMFAVKFKQVDQVIHEELPTQEIMELQEKQKSFDFLHDVREDIYSEEDLIEKWIKEQ